jgi:hypothetical protein
MSKMQAYGVQVAIVIEGRGEREDRERETLSFFGTSLSASNVEPSHIQQSGRSKVHVPTGSQNLGFESSRTVNPFNYVQHYATFNSFKVAD